MESSKLRFAEELSIKVQRLLSSEDIDNLAEKELIPHYRLLNPVTNKVRYMYHNSEILDFIDKKLLANVKQIKPVTIVSFGNSGFSKVEDSNKPKELDPLKNEVFELDPAMFNAPSGVYFLYNNDKMVYIGQSINVTRRGMDHITERKKIFNKMYFIRIPRESLLETERMLINHFKPKYNKSKKEKVKLKELEYFKLN